MHSASVCSANWACVLQWNRLLNFRICFPRKSQFKKLAAASMLEMHWLNYVPAMICFGIRQLPIGSHSGWIHCLPSIQLDKKVGSWPGHTSPIRFKVRLPTQGATLVYAWNCATGFALRIELGNRKRKQTSNSSLLTGKSSYRIEHVHGEIHYRTTSFQHH